ncbi:MAG: recombinase family protein [Deltaproteobacteria bacterium]|nr:recombinase family protein [Deltaproteobacteria bacterium]
MQTQRAIGYIRVSTAGQAVDGISLEAQEARIRAWSEANGYELGSVHVDAGISGKRADNRPGLQAALVEIQKGAALVVYSLSRLARSTKDAISIAEALDRKGADLVSLSERIDTTSAAGKMVFRMLAVLAEFERDLTAERTSAALAHKKAKGEKYGPVPFGYTEISGRLAAVQAEADVVLEILERRAAGESLRAIAYDLNARGVATKQGKRWHASTIRYLERSRAAA